MLLHLLTPKLQLILAMAGFVTLASAFAAIAKTWIEHLNMITRVTAQNERFHSALKGAKPHQRAEILRAFFEKESHTDAVETSVPSEDSAKPDRPAGTAP